MNLGSFFAWVLSASLAGSAAAIIVFLAKVLFRNQFSAGWHYVIWFVVLLRLLVPYSPGVGVNLTDYARGLLQKAGVVDRIAYPPPQGGMSATADSAVAPQPVVAEPGGIPPSVPAENHAGDGVPPATSTVPAHPAFRVDLGDLAILWVAGAVTVGVAITASYRRFLLRVNREGYCPDAETLPLVDEVRTLLSINTRVSVVLTRTVQTPSLVGLIHPRLLLPAGLWASLSSEQRRHVVAHELAHVRRKDILANWLGTVFEVLHWFNPVIWFALAEMRQDCETACDATALSFIGAEARRGYGRTIVNVLEASSQPSWLPGIAGAVVPRGIKRRISMIARFEKGPSPWSAAATFAALALALTVAFSGCNGIAAVQQDPPPGTATATDSFGKSGSTFSSPGSVTMVDTENGWALTPPALLRTTDGGDHWMDVTPAGAGGPGDRGMGRLFASGPNSAWFARGPGAGVSGADALSVALFHTTDGGKTWAESRVGDTGSEWANPVGISFTDENHGSIMINYGGVALGSEMVGVFTTTDGGATWNQVALTDSASSSGNSLPFGGIKSGVTFADATHAWATGNWHGDGVWLYFSADGGQTWQHRDLPVPGGYSTQGGSVDTLPPLFFGSHGVLPVVFHSERSIIFFTTPDSGETWTASTPLASAADSYEFNWCFLDGIHGWVSDTSRLFATSDGGATWTEVKSDSVLDQFLQAGYHIGQMGFGGEGGGWLLLRRLPNGGSIDQANYRLLRTSDGGGLWSDTGAVSARSNAAQTNLRALTTQDLYGGPMLLEDAPRGFADSLQDKVAALTVPDARKGERAVPLVESGESLGDGVVSFLNSIPDQNVFLYGYRDADYPHYGLILDIGEEQHIYAFPYLYATNSTIAPDLSASKDGSTIYVSCSIAGGTGVSVHSLYIFRVRGDQVESYNVNLSDLVARLNSKVTMSYDAVNKRASIYSGGNLLTSGGLTAVGVAGGTDIAPDSFYFGNQIHYTLMGDSIKVSCIPTLYSKEQTGAQIYLDNWVSLDADINFTFDGSGRIVDFEIGGITANASSLP